VIINIINNAVDALEGREKKEIILMTAVQSNDDGKMNMQLIISDNGQGIAADKLPKIFDSFFTTKEKGKGTGLGLSIAREIIQGHGGRIWAENNNQGGATFIIELPVE
jgi:signal transduction histidine kinase